MENEEIEFEGTSVTIDSVKGGYIVIIDGEPQVTTSLHCKKLLVLHEKH